MATGVEPGGAWSNGPPQPNPMPANQSAFGSVPQSSVPQNQMPNGYGASFSSFAQQPAYSPGYGNQSYFPRGVPSLDVPLGGGFDYYPSYFGNYRGNNFNPYYRRGRGRRGGNNQGQNQQQQQQNNNNNNNANNNNKNNQNNTTNAVGYSSGSESDGLTKSQRRNRRRRRNSSAPPNAGSGQNQPQSNPAPVTPKPRNQSPAKGVTFKDDSAAEEDKPGPVLPNWGFSLGKGSKRKNFTSYFKGLEFVPPQEMVEDKSKMTLPLTYLLYEVSSKLPWPHELPKSDFAARHFSSSPLVFKTANNAYLFSIKKPGQIISDQKMTNTEVIVALIRLIDPKLNYCCSYKYGGALLIMSEVINLPYNFTPERLTSVLAIAVAKGVHTIVGKDEKEEVLCKEQRLAKLTSIAKHVMSGAAFLEIGKDPSKINSDESNETIDTAVTKSPLVDKPKPQRKPKTDDGELAIVPGKSTPQEADILFGDDTSKTAKKSRGFRRRDRSNSLEYDSDDAPLPNVTVTGFYQWILKIIVQDGTDITSGTGFLCRTPPSKSSKPRALLVIPAHVWDGKHAFKAVYYSSGVKFSVDFVKEDPRLKILLHTAENDSVISSVDPEIFDLDFEDLPIIGEGNPVNAYLIAPIIDNSQPGNPQLIFVKYQCVSDPDCPTDCDYCPRAGMSGSPYISQGKIYGSLVAVANQFNGEDFPKTVHMQIVLYEARTDESGKSYLNVRKSMKSTFTETSRKSIPLKRVSATGARAKAELDLLCPVTKPVTPAYKQNTFSVFMLFMFLLFAGVHGILSTGASFSYNNNFQADTTPERLADQMLVGSLTSLQTPYIHYSCQIIGTDLVCSYFDIRGPDSPNYLSCQGLSTVASFEYCFNLFIKSFDVTRLNRPASTQSKGIVTSNAHADDYFINYDLNFQYGGFTDSVHWVCLEYVSLQPPRWIVAPFIEGCSDNGVPRASPDCYYAPKYKCNSFKSGFYNRLPAFVSDTFCDNQPGDCVSTTSRKKRQLSTCSCPGWVEGCTANPSCDANFIDIDCQYGIDDVACGTANFKLMCIYDDYYKLFYINNMIYCTRDRPCHSDISTKCFIYQPDRQCTCTSDGVILKLPPSFNGTMSDGVRSVLPSAFYISGDSDMRLYYDSYIGLPCFVLDCLVDSLDIDIYCQISVYDGYSASDDIAYTELYVFPTHSPILVQVIKHTNSYEVILNSNSTVFPSQCVARPDPIVSGVLDHYRTDGTTYYMLYPCDFSTSAPFTNGANYLVVGSSGFVRLSASGASFVFKPYFHAKVSNSDVITKYSIVHLYIQYGPQSGTYEIYLDGFHYVNVYTLYSSNINVEAYGGLYLASSQPNIVAGDGVIHANFTMQHVGSCDPVRFPLAVDDSKILSKSVIYNDVPSINMQDKCAYSNISVYCSNCTGFAFDFDPSVVSNGQVLVSPNAGGCSLAYNQQCIGYTSSYTSLGFYDGTSFNLTYTNDTSYVTTPYSTSRNYAYYRLYGDASGSVIKYQSCKVYGSPPVVYSSVFPTVTSGCYSMYFCLPSVESVYDFRFYYFDNSVFDIVLHVVNKSDYFSVVASSSIFQTVVYNFVDNGCVYANVCLTDNNLVLYINGFRHESPLLSADSSFNRVVSDKLGFSGTRFQASDSCARNIVTDASSSPVTLPFRPLVGRDFNITSDHYTLSFYDIYGNVNFTIAINGSTVNMNGLVLDIGAYRDQVFYFVYYADMPRLLVCALNCVYSSYIPFLTIGHIEFSGSNSAVISTSECDIPGPVVPRTDLLVASKNSIYCLEYAFTVPGNLSLSLSFVSGPVIIRISGCEFNSSVTIGTSSYSYVDVCEHHTLSFVYTNMLYIALDGVTIYTGFEDFISISFVSDMFLSYSVFDSFGVCGFIEPLTTTSTTQYTTTIPTEPPTTVPVVVFDTTISSTDMPAVGSYATTPITSTMFITYTGFSSTAHHVTTVKRDAYSKNVCSSASGYVYFNSGNSVSTSVTNLTVLADQALFNFYVNPTSGGDNYLTVPASRTVDMYVSLVQPVQYSLFTTIPKTGELYFDGSSVQRKAGVVASYVGSVVSIDELNYAAYYKSRYFNISMIYDSHAFRVAYYYTPDCTNNIFAHTIREVTVQFGAYSLLGRTLIPNDMVQKFHMKVYKDAVFYTCFDLAGTFLTREQCRSFSFKYHWTGKFLTPFVGLSTYIRSLNTDTNLVYLLYMFEDSDVSSPYKWVANNVVMFTGTGFMPTDGVYHNVTDTVYSDTHFVINGWVRVIDIVPYSSILADYVGTIDIYSSPVFPAFASIPMPPYSIMFSDGNIIAHCPNEFGDFGTGMLQCVFESSFWLTIQNNTDISHKGDFYYLVDNVHSDYFRYPATPINSYQPVPRPVGHGFSNTFLPDAFGGRCNFADSPFVSVDDKIVSDYVVTNDGMPAYVDVVSRRVTPSGQPGPKTSYIFAQFNRSLSVDNSLLHTPSIYCSKDYVFNVDVVGRSLNFSMDGSGPVLARIVRNTYINGQMGLENSSLEHTVNFWYDRHMDGYIIDGNQFGSMENLVAYFKIGLDNDFHIVRIWVDDCYKMSDVFTFLQPAADYKCRHPVAFPIILAAIAAGLILITILGVWLAVLSKVSCASCAKTAVYNNYDSVRYKRIRGKGKVTIDGKPVVYGGHPIYVDSDSDDCPPDDESGPNCIDYKKNDISRKKCKKCGNSICTCGGSGFKSSTPFVSSGFKPHYFLRWSLLYCILAPVFGNNVTYDFLGESNYFDFAWAIVLLIVIVIVGFAVYIIYNAYFSSRDIKYSELLKPYINAPNVVYACVFPTGSYDGEVFIPASCEYYTTHRLDESGSARFYLFYDAMFEPGEHPFYSVPDCYFIDSGIQFKKVMYMRSQVDGFLVYEVNSKGHVVQNIPMSSKMAKLVVFLFCLAPGFSDAAPLFETTPVLSLPDSKLAFTTFWLPLVIFTVGFIVMFLIALYFIKQVRYYRLRALIAPSVRDSQLYDYMTGLLLSCPGTGVVCIVAASGAIDPILVPRTVTCYSLHHYRSLDSGENISVFVFYDRGVYRYPDRDHSEHPIYPVLGSMISERCFSIDGVCFYQDPNTLTSGSRDSVVVPFIIVLTSFYFGAANACSTAASSLSENFVVSYAALSTFIFGMYDFYANVAVNIADLVYRAPNYIISGVYYIEPYFEVTLSYLLPIMLLLLLYVLGRKFSRYIFLVLVVTKASALQFTTKSSYYDNNNKIYSSISLVDLIPIAVGAHDSIDVYPIDINDLPDYSVQPLKFSYQVLNAQCTYATRYEYFAAECVHANWDSVVCCGPANCANDGIDLNYQKYGYTRFYHLVTCPGGCAGDYPYCACCACDNDVCLTSYFGMNVVPTDPKTYVQFVTLLPAVETITMRFCFGITCKDVNVTQQTDYNVGLGNGTLKVANTFSLGCKMGNRGYLLYSGLVYEDYLPYGTAAAGVLGDCAARAYSNVSTVAGTKYIQQAPDLYVSPDSVIFTDTTTSDDAHGSFHLSGSGFKNFQQNVLSGSKQPLTGGNYGNVYYVSQGIAQNTVYEDQTSGSALEFSFIIPDYTFVVSNKIPKLLGFQLSVTDDCQFGVKIITIHAVVNSDVAGTISYTCTPSCLTGIFNAEVGNNSFAISYFPRQAKDHVTVTLVADGSNVATTDLDCKPPSPFVQNVYRNDASVTETRRDGFSNPFGFLSDIRFQIGFGISISLVFIIAAAVLGFYIYKRKHASSMVTKAKKFSSLTESVMQLLTSEDNVYISD